MGIIGMQAKEVTQKTFRPALYTMCVGRSKAKFKPYEFVHYFNMIKVLSRRILLDCMMEFT